MIEKVGTRKLFRGGENILRYTKKLPYTDLAVQAWYVYFNHAFDLKGLPRARVKDWWAVEETLKRFAAEECGGEKTKLLRMVFGVRRRDSMSARVLCAALDLNVSEATAWGWLRQANQYWAESRGVA